MTLTTGFATETVATEGTSFPVASEICCTRKPTIPPIAMTQSSQSPKAPQPSLCRLSTTGFISVAESPKRMPATVPRRAAFTVSPPRFANRQSATQLATMTMTAASHSEPGAESTPPAGSPMMAKIASPTTMTAAPSP